MESSAQSSNWGLPYLSADAQKEFEAYGMHYSREKLKEE